MSLVIKSLGGGHTQTCTHTHINNCKKPGVLTCSWCALGLKMLKSISVECMECLNKDVKKKKDTSWTSGGRNDQISTSKLLDITHESYVFSGDLIETIN